MPLAECRFPGLATRRLGRLRRESERSTPNGRAKTLCGGGGGVVVVVVVLTPTPNYLRQASQNLGKYATVYRRFLPYDSVDVSA